VFYGFGSVIYCILGRVLPTLVRIGENFNDF
jgi:hypothetical protein